jgi:hypothetical protein
MGERTATREARKAVAKLIERYFTQLKKELVATGDEFWKRIELALATKSEQRAEEPVKPVEGS